jgi:hypothetical protein
MFSEIRVIFVLSLQLVLCVVPMHLNTTFDSWSHGSTYFLKKFLVLLESSDRHYLLFAVTPVSNWSAVNTPKCLDVPAMSDST